MKIKWLGHASMMITANNGSVIITDPYEKGAFGLEHESITERADVVTVSHDHADHNNTATVAGNPAIIKGKSSQKIKGIDFRGIGSYHDESKGEKRGSNTIFCISGDGLNLCHLGDLGHILSAETVAEIGPVDVLFVPVGGNFTIDAKAAADVCRALNPRIVIPMHFCNDRCPRFPVARVEEFLKLMENSQNVSGSEIEVTPEALPQQMTVKVLKPAL